MTNAFMFVSSCKESSQQINTQEPQSNERTYDAGREARENDGQDRENKEKLTGKRERERYRKAKKRQKNESE